MLATRVQYSDVGTQVNLDNKKEEIFINIYAIMDKNRYSKKRYEQKLSDCNQVRNLIFDVQLFVKEILLELVRVKNKSNRQ